MKNKTANSLENFLHTFLDRAGAVVEKPSYGLLEALVPQELANRFGAEELLLAFDYEVARETPGSIFIAPGSAVLDTAVRLAAPYGLFTVHYWPGREVRRPKNLDQKIAKAVDYLHCRPPSVASHYLAENVYYMFNFLCVFRSFEKTEEIIPVVINGHNGVPFPSFETYWQNIIPLEHPLSRLAQARTSPVRDLYAVACRAVGQLAGERSLLYREAGTLLRQKELEKTGRYYRETLSELEKKHGESSNPARQKKLQDQLAATRADWQHRQDDIVARYDLEVEVLLDHLVVCRIPCLFLQVEVQHKTSLIRQTLVYNPLNGEVETPPCPRCGKPAPLLIPDEKGGLICAAHE
ncbi:MAG: hypothetical protein Q7J85_07965 [Bacillota bacterium]|nr:hypothetical protein [Bacillota bacterium]